MSVVTISGNNSYLTAYDLNGLFAVSYDPNVERSATYPHASVWSLAESGTMDWYKLTITSDTTATFDIDFGMYDFHPALSIKTLRDGNWVLVGGSSFSFPADPGSLHYYDPKMTINLSPGTYYVEVNQYPGTYFTRGDYQLNVTLNTFDINLSPIVSGPVTGSGQEDGAVITLDALANASDPNGDALRVVGLPASLPAGVSYNAADHTISLDPAHANFQHLAAGEVKVLNVGYKVSDGWATVPTYVSFRVEGINDAPVAYADSGSVSEDASITLDVLHNDWDLDWADTKTLSSVGATALGGSVSIEGGQIVYVADDDAFDLLTLGQSVQDSFTYTMTDAAGAASTATVTVTVSGVADGADIVGGNKAQTLNGTPLDEKISGGNANDTLYGNDGADRLYGDNGADTLYGGQGRDQLFGGNGGDLLEGGAGHDTLTGGTGPDTFKFAAGSGADVVADFATEDTLVFASSQFSTSAQAFAAAAQDGGDVLITAWADSVRLVGVSLSSLTVADFVIG